MNEIEKFLIESKSLLNPLFSTPLFAERIKKCNKFNYKYEIEEEKGKIKDLCLLFQKYRGYKKIPPILGYFFRYWQWDNPPTQTKTLQKILLKYKNLKYCPIPKNANIENTKEWATYIINLNEEIKYSRRLKRILKKSHNIEIKILEKKDVPKFYKWLLEVKDFNNKKHLITNDKRILYDMKLFSNSPYIYKIFYATLNNKIISSLGIWGFNDYISEWGVFNSPYVIKNKIYAQDLIKNHIIQYFKNTNIKYYDLSGFNPNPTTKKEENIKNFKSKFGGKIFKYKIIK